MPPPLLRAETLLRIALYDAAAHGKLVEDPDVVLDLLGTTIDDLEAAARRLRRETDELTRTHEAERALWDAERQVLTDLRDRAERDALAVVTTPQSGPLENPAGYYVYFLWGAGPRLLYVGMSTNALGRLGKHLGDPSRRRHIVRVTTLGCPDESSMRRMELAAIREHRPEWNIAGVPA